MRQRVCVLNFYGATLMATNASTELGPAIKLPKPETDGELIQALRSRKSTREFSTRQVSPDLLSTLLWVAFGINRPAMHGRTAPSAHGWQEIDVYIALADGLYRYDASAHAMTRLVAKDLRSLTGIQDYVATAPVNFLYVVDFSRMGDASEEDRLFFAATDAAVIAENVYLFCAARGLATVVRGLVDRKMLAAAVGLRKDQRIVLAQSVGFPAA